MAVLIALALITTVALHPFSLIGWICGFLIWRLISRDRAMEESAKRYQPEDHDS